MTTPVEPSNPTLATALERLRTGVTALMTSNGWRAALEFRARLHTYSFLNSSLILAQRPDATLVAGFRRWQDLGRHVSRGEKGIAILAPLLRTDPNDADSKILTGFRTVYVFDVRQTSGEPVPEPPRPQRLDGDGPLVQAATRHLTSFAAQQGISVRDDLTHPTALGAYVHATRAIRMRPDLAPLQYLKTLVHEMAHALLHDPSVDQRAHAELEAESCAYLVCHQLGLDTSAYSFAYLANWAPSLEALLQSGDRACRAATQIHQALEPHLTEPGIAALPPSTSVPVRPPTRSLGAGR